MKLISVVTSTGIRSTSCFWFTTFSQEFPPERLQSFGMPADNDPWPRRRFDFAFAETYCTTKCLIYDPAANGSSSAAATVRKYACFVPNVL
jgi:hypothetical protein